MGLMMGLMMGVQLSRIQLESLTVVMTVAALRH